MSDPIKVTVSDPETGAVLEERLLDNDFIVLCAGNRYLHSVQAHGNGTQVVTVKVDRDHVTPVVEPVEPVLPLDPWPYASIGGSRHTKSWPHNSFAPRPAYEQDEAKYTTERES